MKVYRWFARALLVALACGVVAAAGCSDDDDTVPTTPTGGGAAAGGQGGQGGTGAQGGTGGLPPYWEPGDPRDTIRPDHPRLFLNADTMPAVLAMAQGAALPHYERLLSDVDGYSAPTGPDDYGAEALNTTFVYLVTGDTAYRDLAKELLLSSLDFYDAQLGAGQAVSWYSRSRICALATYDWLHGELSTAERSEILGRLLQHVNDVQPEVTEDVAGRNSSDHTTGFYGVQNLIWYAGVVGFGDGVDDARAEQFLLDGLEHHVALYDHRRMSAGDDGGTASGAINYAFGAYPWAELNFLHSWQSAMGEDLAPYWTHLALLTPWVLYSWLPGEHVFGFGDDYHTDNVLGFWSGRLHLNQFAHFFRDTHPELAGLAWWMRAQLGDDDPFDALSRSTWGTHPFLLTRLAAPPAPVAPPATLPLARHFEEVGQVMLRSGPGPDDTYAMFVAGGSVTSHRHFDANHFAIYHRGFLALDTGTRLGEGSAETTEHMSEYYARTIGHNAMLVYDPSEVFDSHYWGYSCDDNDGGQNARDTSVIAFESTDGYAYVAGDATGCYNPSKTTEVVRQFVFLPPHHFVVFDRVTATNAAFGKHWLLHTAEQPTVQGDVVHHDQNQGRLYLQALLPANPSIAVVGGAGHEFEVFGTNYPFGGYAQDMTDLMGRYRVEISPSSPATADAFLVLLQVGDTSLAAMTQGQLVEQGDEAGVGFDHQGRSFEVRFRRTGAVGGHVLIQEGSTTVVDQDLVETVQSQSGFPG